MPPEPYIPPSSHAIMGVITVTVPDHFAGSIVSGDICPAVANCRELVLVEVGRQRHKDEDCHYGSHNRGPSLPPACNKHSMKIALVRGGFQLGCGTQRERNIALCQPTKRITVDVHCIKLLYTILILISHVRLPGALQLKQTDIDKPL